MNNDVLTDEYREGYRPATPPPAVPVVNGRPLVYLAGPIAGMRYEDAIAWRDAAHDRLNGLGIDTLSPLRGKAALSGQGTVARNYRTYAHKGLLFSGQGIMTRDHFDVVRCDLLLVNLLVHDEVSYGTAMELAWAYHARKPVVAMVNAGSEFERHPMLDVALGPYRTGDPDEAYDLVASLLGR